MSPPLTSFQLLSTKLRWGPDKREVTLSLHTGAANLEIPVLDRWAPGAVKTFFKTLRMWAMVRFVSLPSHRSGADSSSGILAPTTLKPGTPMASMQLFFFFF